MTESEARAFAFTVLISANLALIISNRSLKNRVTAMRRKPNFILWGVMLGTACLLILIIQFPFLENVFYFSALSLELMLMAIVIGCASVMLSLIHI